MARKRAGEGVEDIPEMGLQLTPMIDVIFQLLLFFLVTIKFPTYEGLLKAFLPKAATNPPPPEEMPDQAFTTIRMAGKDQALLYVNDTETPLGRLVVQSAGHDRERVYLEPEGALENTFKLMQEVLGDKPLTVIIKGDRRLEYKFVIYVLNICGRLKIDNVMFSPPG